MFRLNFATILMPLDDLDECCRRSVEERAAHVDQIVEEFRALLTCEVAGGQRILARGYGLEKV